MGSQSPALLLQALHQDHFPAAAEDASDLAPEFAPADAGAPPPPAARKRPLWAAAPATYLLVGINCGVFLAMVAHHISPWMPTVDQLMNWGADRPNNVLDRKSVV